MLKSENKIYSNKGNRHVFNCIKGSEKLILDLGCGDGSLASRLVSESHVVDGITLSRNEEAKAKVICRKTFVFNLENGLPESIKAEYDYIICSHILEHLCYPNKLLSDLKSRLKTNGKLIIALPNLMHYKSRIQLILGNFDYEDSGVWDYTHFRWYTIKSAERLLKEQGYTIEKKWVTGNPPFNSIFSRMPSRITEGIFYLCCLVSKGLFANQMLFILNKRNID